MGVDIIHHHPFGWDPLIPGFLLAISAAYCFVLGWAVSRRSSDGVAAGVGLSGACIAMLLVASVADDVIAIPPAARLLMVAMPFAMSLLLGSSEEIRLDAALRLPDPRRFHSLGQGHSDALRASSPWPTRRASWARSHRRRRA